METCGNSNPSLRRAVALDDYLMPRACAAEDARHSTGDYRAERIGRGTGPNRESLWVTAMADKGGGMPRFVAAPAIATGDAAPG